MSPPHDNRRPPPAVEDAERVQIANLVPENLASSNAYIDAQIALVWPYSSSTRQFAFLLSEPDARPLKSRRQVKISLYNGAARAVQSSKVGIGDQIRLVLRGCQWRDSEDPTATPGKRIKWDLVYRKAIALEVKKTASEEARFVQYESTGTPSPRSTPLTNGTVQSVAPASRVYGSPDLEVSFDAPVSRRTSGIYAYTGASEDPFLEDIEKDAGKSRKRTKFARPSGSWRLLDDDLEETTAMPLWPSDRQVAVDDGSQNDMDQGLLDRPEQPTSPLLPQNDSVEISTAAEEASLPLSEHQPLQQAGGAILPVTASIGSFETDAVPGDVMGPPTAPVRPRPDMRLQLSPEQGLEPEDKVTTPRLHPMSSQGLPLISPLIKQTGAETGYFPDPPGQTSELDAISHPATEAKTAGSVESEESEHESESDKSVVVEEQAEMAPRPLVTSDTKQDLERPPQAAILIEDDDEVEVIEQDSQMRGEETEQSRPFRFEQTRARSPPLGLMDGIVESQSDAIPEHVRLLQGNFERQEPKLLEVSEARVTSTDLVTEQNKTSGPYIADEPSQLPSDQQSSDTKDDALTENAPIVRQESTLPVFEEQLMTPAQSQNVADSLVSDKHIPVVVSDQEPLTPQATQTEVAKASFEQTPDAGKVSILEMKDEGDPHTQLTSATSRRVSQRLTRKAEALPSIESPFFTRRKTAKEDGAVEDIPIEPTSPQVHEPRVRQSRTAEPEQYEIQESTSAKGKQAATYKGTNTALAYYPSLAQLREYYGQTVDIIAVCAEPTSRAVRAKSGPRDWHTTLRLVDPDTTDAKTTAQVFRPYKEALPFAQLGDILILRSFKVQTAKGKWTLLSTDSSAWAVFKSNPGSRAMFDNVEMTGPQLEYGRGETAHVKELVQWWANSGRTTFARGEGLSMQDRQQDVGIIRDPPFEEAAVLESVEQATSPRRSRRLHPEADTSNELGPQSQDSAKNAGTVATPQASPREATRRARTKTPNTPPRQLPAPSSMRPTASDTSSLPPVSPRHTRRHTRSTLSPAVSFSAVGSQSAASSIAATSPTEATFGTQSKSKPKGKAKAGSKGKDKDAQQQQQAEELQSGGQQQGQPTRSTRSKNTQAASPLLVHELRDGMRYVDEQEGEAPPKRATRSQVHELRDGNRYVDDVGK